MNENARRQKKLKIIVTLILSISVIFFFIFRPSDERSIQGYWTDGELKLTISGDIAIMDGKSLPTASRLYYSLQSGSRPKRIMVWDSSTPGLVPRYNILGFSFGTPVPGNQNAVMNGIYELKKDSLRILFSSPGSDFPKNFNDEGGTLFELRRP